MIYNNLIKDLTTEDLANAGFQFDGYYYINPKCIVKLNACEEGFMVNLKDDDATPSNQTIKTYQELLAIMINSLNYTIGVSVADKQFTSANEQASEMAAIVKNYMSFDPNINILMTITPNGLEMTPNNEYTFSMANGGIKKFKICYKLNTAESPMGLMILNIAPQCISWPFVMKLLMEELNWTADSGVKFEVESIKIIDNGNEIPFFGTGIPTIQQAPSSSGAEALQGC